MRVYLSQPFAGYDVFSVALSQLGELLELNGDQPIDPLKFDVSLFSDAGIVDFDLSQVESCDVIVCDLTTPNYGGGVWGEFYHVYHKKIPIVVICPDNAWSSPWIRHHSAYRFNSNLPVEVKELYEVCKSLHASRSPK